MSVALVSCSDDESGPDPAGLGPGTHELTFDGYRGEYSYVLDVPADHDLDTPIPLVPVLHGDPGTAAAIRATSGMGALAGPELDVVHIRFPNTEGKPLAGCEAGTIVYVFTPGELTVCPYLVFAARTPQSRHDPAEFIVGNIFTDADIADRLDAYRFHQRYQVGANPTCGSCAMADGCGKGCPAAVISAGQKIGAVDAEICPVTTRARLLPLVPA